MSSTTVDISQEQTWKSSINPWLTALTVMLSTFMVVLDSSIANVALPQMAGSFSATSEEVTWVLTSYLIANGIILPATAWFSSIFGRKNFLIICVIIFTIASALCGMAHSLDMMILSRILQGLGGGALIPISQAIMLESFPNEKRGLAMAVFGIGVVFAPVIGPTLGGWITYNYSWHWIFLINVPIGIIAVFMSYLFVEDPPYMQKTGMQKIDYIGFLALIIWLVTLQIVLDNGQKSDWFDATWVCWTSFVSACAMIFFFVWEIHYKDSIIDLSVFKDRNFTVGTALNTCVGAILYSTLAILPLFLQNLLGYTAYHSGMAITPRGFGTLLSILIVGYVSGKVDDRILIGIGFSLMAVSCFMFGNLNLQISMTNIIMPNFICGLGLGLIFIPLTTLSFATLLNHQMTNATGIQNLLRNIGGAVGTSLVSTLITRGAQTHQANLVHNLSQYNPVFQQKFMAAKSFLAQHMSSVVATKKANYLIYSQLLEQANLCSFIDCFRLYGILCLILIPALVLFKKVKNSKSHNNTAALH